MGEVQMVETTSGSGNSTSQPIEGFELQKKIGEGGMGAVYLARQISMDRLVALKILRRSLARNSDFVDRFVREARLAGKLDHTNIVRALDVGQSGEYHYLAMEYVDGRNLAAILREQGILPEKEALGLVLQVARALEYAHSREIIHRDVKPDNVMLASDGTVKLTDMGLAKQTGAESHLTQTGEMLGTPHYVSPEQARGQEDVDIRSDIYALGATMYRLLTGRTPFDGPTGAVVMTKHLTEEPTPPQEVNPQISNYTSRIICMAMTKDREHRYQLPSEMISDLEDVLAGRSPGHAIKPGQAANTGKTRPVSPVRRRRGTRLAERPVNGTEKRKPPMGLIAGIAAGVLVLAGVTGFLLTGGQETETKPPVKKVVTVPEKTPEESPETPPESAGEEKNFEEMFNYASDFWQKNPEEYSQALRKFSTVKTEASGTIWSMKAVDAIEEVTAARDRAVKTAFKMLSDKSRALTQTGDFDSALAIWSAKPDNLAKQLLPLMAEGLKKVAQEADGRVGTTLAQAEKKSREGRPHQAITELNKLAGVKYAKYAPKIAELRKRFENEKKNDDVLSEKRQRAQARLWLKGLLAATDPLLLSGNYSPAAAQLLAARKKASQEHLALVNAEFSAAEKIAGLLCAHLRAQSKTIDKLVGKKLDLRKTNGARLKGTVEKVENQVLTVKVAFKIGGTVGYSVRKIPFTDIAEADRRRLLPEFKPRDADGQLARALLALTAKDYQTAETAIAKAGKHPLSERYRVMLDTCRLGAVEGSAKRAWEKSIDLREKYNMPQAKALLVALDKYLAEHSKTKFATGLSQKITGLRAKAQAVIDASPEGIVAKVGKLYHGKVVRFDPRTLSIELLYDFETPRQIRDWELSIFAAGKLLGPGLELAQGRLHLNRGGRGALLSGMFRSMSISADFMVHAGKGNCALLVCADNRGNWYNLFGKQESNKSGIERYTAGKQQTLGKTPPSPFAGTNKGRISLSFSEGKLTGTVGGLRLSALDKTYPYGRVGLWSFDTRTSYDNIRVTGILDKTWLKEQLARQAARSAPVIAYRASWQKLAIKGPKPQPRSNCYDGLDYDSKRKRIIMYGGHWTNWNDLWVLDLARLRWTCLQKNQPKGPGVGKTRPPGMVHFCFNYDSGNDLYWVMHNWAYNPNTGKWRLTGIDPLKGLPNLGYGPWTRSGLAYDPDGKRFMWCKGPGALFKPGEAGGVKLPNGPPYRSYPDGGLVYDRKNKAFVFFGGMMHQGPIYNDTWAFYTTTRKWRQLGSEKTPPARCKHKLHWSDKLGAILLYSGTDKSGKKWLNDLWVLDIASERWTQLNPTGNPPPVCEIGSVYDSDRNRLLVYPSRTGEIWSLKVEKTPAR
jgi:eukaryotic-like serine/threonine-protein kinase